MLSFLVAAATTLAASAGTPFPGSPVTNQASPVPWPVSSGLIDAGVKSSDSYTDGHFSITAPVFSSIGRNGTLGGSLVFVEPYISWGEQSEVATSLGAGFRHLWSEQPVSALQQRPTGWLDEGIMVGGNLFVDMLNTRSSNSFWQLGGGLEVSTRYLEVRGNYYQPLTGRQEGDPYVDRQVSRGTLITDGREPFAKGHTIQQDVTFTTYDFYTDRIYRYYEEGMQGWDVEAAVLVPGLDRWCELWLVGGYGKFDNQPFGPQIAGTGEMEGWKAGVELRPLPQLVMSATWYEEERMGHGDWLYGLSLQIPIDPEPGNPDKSWWRKFKDSLKRRSRHLAERAAVPVHRQNAAVKIANSIGEPEIKQYAQKVSSEEKRLVVRDDVIFVNNTGAQGNGIRAAGAVENGTAEHPFDTIEEGVALSSNSGYQSRGVPTVYVAGGGSNYTGNGFFGLDESTLNMPSGLHLASGGYGITAYAGHSFGLGTPAQVVLGSFLTMGGGTGSSQSRYISVDGFDFLGRVLVTGEHVNVRNNTVSDGLIVEGFDAVVTGNTIIGDFQVRDSLFAETRHRPNSPTTALVSGNNFMSTGVSDVSMLGFSSVIFADNTMNWLVPGIGGAPGQPLAAVRFENCADVTLGRNWINVIGSRKDIPGLAVFSFSGRANVHDFGDNAVFGRGTSQGVYGVYFAPTNLPGVPTVISGSLSINGDGIELHSSSGLFPRLW